MIIDFDLRPLVRKMIMDIGNSVFCVHNTEEAMCIIKDFAERTISFDYILIAKEKETFQEQMRSFEETNNLRPSKIIAY